MLKFCGLFKTSVQTPSTIPFYPNYNVIRQCKGKRNKCKEEELDKEEVAVLSLNLLESTKILHYMRPKQHQMPEIELRKENQVYGKNRWIKVKFSML